jgi:hypothetical protein
MADSVRRMLCTASMVVRITKLNGSTASVLKVEGLLQAADVDLLYREWAAISGQAALDLSGLRSADSIGVDAIRSLESQGAELRGLCPYLELLVSTGSGHVESCDQRAQLCK